MFPIGDENRRRSFPFITILLILANVLVFLIETNSGADFIIQWSFIPRRFLASPPGYFITIFSSLFMHASWSHLLGNMLYLWVFGDNIEDLFGHVRFLAFYLACGVVATFAQFAFMLHANVLILGASGAIAGILGAYFLAFGGSQIKIWVFFTIIRVEAWLAIGLWIVWQIILVWISGQAAATGGVAYMAHVGGFVAGLVIAWPYRKGSRMEA